MNAAYGERNNKDNVTDELSRPVAYVALPWRCEMSTVSQYGMRRALSINSRCQMGNYQKARHSVPPPN